MLLLTHLVSKFCPLGWQLKFQGKRFSSSHVAVKVFCIMNCVQSECNKTGCGLQEAVSVGRVND